MEKHDRWLIGMSILIVLAYAWLTAWSLEPRWLAPARVTLGVSWVENGTIYTSQEIAKRDLGLVMRVQEELNATDTALAILGPYRTPPSVVIHLNSDFRYTVDADRVDLSSQVASAPGQLTKAMLKAWWYQRPTSAWAASSLLSFEVMTDVLTAIARNEPVLGNPATGQEEEFPVLAPWLDFASSYDSSRDLSWSLMELRNFKGRAPRMNPLAFRPLLNSILWSVFAKTSSLERLALVRSWIRSLEATTSALDASPRPLPPESLLEWSEWLRREVRDLAGPRPAIEDELEKAGLSANAPLAISATVFTPDANLQVEEVAKASVGHDDSHDSSAQTWALKGKNDENWLLSKARSSERRAWLQLSQKDWQTLRPAKFFWAGCRVPSVSEILKAAGGAEKLAFAAVCDPAGVRDAVRAFALGGVTEVASRLPDVEFVQMRRSALELAIRQGRLRPASRLSDFSNPKLSGFLGINAAKWIPQLGAFRVVGAIEVVELIRGGKFSGSHAGDMSPGASSHL